MVGTDERQLKESATWNHLKNVVSRIVTERPPNAMDNFETQSHYVLTGKVLPPQTNSIYLDTRPRDKQLVSEAVTGDTEWAFNFGSQFAPVKATQKPSEDEEAAEPEEDEEDKGELCDVVVEQAHFNRFGEGLPETEAFRVMVSMKRLLDKEPLAKLRFWGKVIGTKHDYYVVEGKIDENRVPEKEPVDEDQPEIVGKPLETIFQGLNTYRTKEPVHVAAEDGRGVNEFKYYVSNTADPTTWVQLPDVLPSHITAARHITKLFSGVLDAHVDCHPPFPGVERHYLRAQIARISHGTIVCPKDIYTTEVPDDDEDEDEEGVKKPKRFEVKPYEEIPSQNTQEVPDAEDPEAVAPLKTWFFGYKHDELMEPKSWVHCVPQMLAEGRVTKYKPEDDDANPDEEEDTNAPVQNEWVHPFLADVAHDKPLSFVSHSRSSFPAWALRKAYHNESSVNRLYLARSLRWPGAFCYAECEDDKPGANFQNMYVGNGLPNREGVVFVPAHPPLACCEFPAKVHLQKDCTRDDELEFEPLPVAPKLPGDENDDEEADE
jgi:radial spoke head protein 4A